MVFWTNATMSLVNSASPVIADREFKLTYVPALRKQPAHSETSKEPEEVKQTLLLYKQQLEEELKKLKARKRAYITEIDSPFISTAERDSIIGRLEDAENTLLVSIKDCERMQQQCQ